MHEIRIFLTMYYAPHNRVILSEAKDLSGFELECEEDSSSALLTAAPLRMTQHTIGFMEFDW